MPRSASDRHGGRVSTQALEAGGKFQQVLYYSEETVTFSTNLPSASLVLKALQSTTGRLFAERKCCWLMLTDLNKARWRTITEEVFPPDVNLVDSQTQALACVETCGTIKAMLGISKDDKKRMRSRVMSLLQCLVVEEYD
ncbi:MAG: hypothetical protein M1816_000552 [Peltula sp. TS41687]|nr:MAG: hypothetical protein M1816_000552 [Peltula sp. TS41687]